MIDIHTHILSGLDDGSYSIDESARMLDIACGNKTKAVILTPHCNVPNMFGNYYSKALQEHFDNFKHHFKDLPIDLYLGMEVFATSNLPQLLENNQIITLNNSRYLLVEFPFLCNINWVSHILQELQQQNITPIIAHPERYSFIQENPPFLLNLIEKGSLVQLNKSSLNGSFGTLAEEIAFILLEHNLVHFIASDCHRSKARTPFMRSTYRHIAEKFGQAYANLLFSENPQKVLNNIKITAPEPIGFFD
ncbi:tyrosine-protein phosphatase YwqE [Clostridia bacterium]|nr:tyrosine-protein phosphatase YwqE [Clostridia bacterium]